MTQALERLRETLEAAQAALPADALLREDADRTLRDRLHTRLSRDLLARVMAAHPGLLVAIAGPNNAGKSTLFNALLGTPLSPARALGGLTRQPLAAAHPALWDSAVRPLLERRFEVELLSPAEVGRVTEGGAPGRLFLVLLPTLPGRLLLMDLPDFDSVYAQNRQAAEAVLLTADLLVFVVTRQTYQNAALVAFLEEAVGRGRPYVLVYNEATSAALAREHLDKLAGDVGTPPLARYVAPHDPAVEGAGAALRLEPLDASGRPLLALFSDQAEGERLKLRAVEASLEDALLELERLEQAVGRAAEEPERLRQRLRHELLLLGERAARRAVPADVVVEAFRDALDAKSPGHKLARWAPRKLSRGLGFVGRKVRGYFVGPEEAPPTPATLTLHELREGLSRLQAALAAEVPGWKGDGETARLLEQTVGAGLAAVQDDPSALMAGADARLAQDAQALRAFCRELFGRELPGGFEEELLQTTATALYFAPVLLGGAAAVVTGGFGGHDVVWVGTLVTTPVLERLVDRLGRDVREAVVQRWTAEHGRSLAKAVEDRVFGALLARLDALCADAARARTALADVRARLLALRTQGGRFAALFETAPQVSSPPEPAGSASGGPPP